MKQNEIMVGDWVCYSRANGYITKVEGIRKYGDEETDYIYAINCMRDKRDPLYEKATHDSFNIEILHPIQLTPDILEKNGFYQEHNVGYVYEDDEFEVIVRLFNNEYRILYNRDVVVNKHCFSNITVNELQHAFNFAEINKEIEMIFDN